MSIRTWQETRQRAGRRGPAAAIDGRVGVDNGATLSRKAQPRMELYATSAVLRILWQSQLDSEGAIAMTMLPGTDVVFSAQGRIPT